MNNFRVNFTDLLILRVAAEGEDFRASLLRKYCVLARSIDLEKYAEGSGSFENTLKRLHERGYLRTTKYKEEGPRKVRHRYIEITPTGREILERIVNVLRIPS